MLKDIALYYSILLIILLIYPTVRLFITWFKHISYITFEIPDLTWNGTLEKPRLFFGIFAYILIKASLHIAYMETLTWYMSAIYLTFGILGITILYFIWTKSFNQKLIKSTKFKIKNYSNQKTIIDSNKYDRNKLYSKLATKYISCTYETFIDFIELNKSVDKIEWKNTTASLLRFLFIVLDIKIEPNKNLNQTFIRNIIQDYFTKNGDAIRLTESGSEISNIKIEIERGIDKENFLDLFKNHLNC